MNKIQKRRKAQKKINIKRHARIKRDKGKKHLAEMIQIKKCGNCWHCLIFKQCRASEQVVKFPTPSRALLELAGRIYADRFSKEEVMSWLL